MPNEILPTDENLSERQLAWGNWWLEHKHQVKAAATIAFGVVGVSMLLYGAWGFLDWFFGSGVRERQQIALLTKDLTDYASFREANAPQPFRTEPVQVIAAGEGRYDLYATITNANDEWWGEFTYEFRGDGLDGKTFKGTVLPAEQRALRRLNVQSAGRSTPELVITGFAWRRIDHHVIQPDFSTWAAKRLDIRFSGVEFVPAGADDPLGVSKARFVAQNAAGFGFHSLTFFVTLYSGSRLIGVNQVVASDLFAGERRQMEATWFNELPNVTRVEITPEADLLDPGTYIAPRD
jgi:hypothetical protein